MSWPRRAVRAPSQFTHKHTPCMHKNTQISEPTKTYECMFTHACTFKCYTPPTETVSHHVQTEAFCARNSSINITLRLTESAASLHCFCFSRRKSWFVVGAKTCLTLICQQCLSCHGRHTHNTREAMLLSSSVFLYLYVAYSMLLYVHVCVERDDVQKASKRHVEEWVKILLILPHWLPNPLSYLYTFV